MPTPLDPRTNDNPSTYVVQDRKNKKELTRLTVQDQVLTASMGGIFSEQADPTVFRHVLDVGCGPGGWLMEAAEAYPTMSLVGIDISQRMIEHARTQARANQLKDRVEFRVMDALRPLDFPAACFDLVNLRFGASFIRTWDWPKLLGELLRVTRPDGVVRVTETDAIPPSSSPALTQFFEMLQCALYRSGHLFTQGNAGLTPHLERLFDQYGFEQVQTKAYALEYRVGTLEGEAYFENWMLLLQNTRAFIQKWNCVSKDYEVIYRQAREEMRQPDFHATWDLLTSQEKRRKTFSYP